MLLLTGITRLLRWGWYAHPRLLLAVGLVLALSIGLTVGRLTRPGPTADSLTRAQQRTARAAVTAHLAQLRRDTVAAARFDTLAAQHHRAAVHHERAADSLHALTHPAHVPPPGVIPVTLQRETDSLLAIYERVFDYHPRPHAPR
ncbi:hypothetical protein [Hymenobacter nivis]|uniref:Uncharacterized protein n=1 Tax=Hymenobacter nivis TaxID=1850093 RepID=A0A502GVQ7_9BACT|nr:hypothetical protein [Hymenobacter nivis]TPG66051.1 hypothetical protein EAH73_11825 [Hymenobacter nivis]